jgi:CubicO group peptidase (beta-lactamase class C family)
VALGALLAAHPGLDYERVLHATVMAPLGLRSANFAAAARDGVALAAAMRRTA